MVKRFRKLMAVLLGATVLVSATPEAALAASGGTAAVESLATFARESAEEVTETAFAGEENENPTVTVDGNGGHTDSGEPSYTVEFSKEDGINLENLLEEKGKFVREGYRLLGWDLKADSTAPKDAWYFDAYETTTYYAIWEEVEALSLGVTKRIAYPEDATWYRWELYYYFKPEEDGWYDFAVEYPENDVSACTLYEDLEFKESIIDVSARGQEKACRLKAGNFYGIYAEVYEDSPVDLKITKMETFVTLDGNGGAISTGESVVDVAVFERDYLDDAVERVGDFEREGYWLAGWATSPDGADMDDDYAIEAEVGKTYYAIWRKLVSVVIYGNGAVTSKGKETITVEDAVEGRYIGWYNSEASNFIAPTGKQFAGLALTADAQQPDNEAVIKEGQALYVVWTNEYYEVKLYANGGYFTSPDDWMFITGGYYGGKLEALPSVVPTSGEKGKVFDKWYRDIFCMEPLETNLAEFSPTEPTVLYAGYKVDETLVNKLTPNKKTASIVVGKTVTLKVTAAPRTALNKAVTWKSSNKKIATVNANGVVTGIAKGTVTITATAKDGSGVKATCKVTVMLPVQTITLNKTKAAVLKGKTLQLKAVAGPKTAGLRTVSWSSSNKKVATVTAEGVVKGIATGTAVITAKAKDGSGVKASCKIYVRQPVTKLLISKTKLTVQKGKTKTLKVVAKPDSAHNKAVTWSSSNKKVATVNAQGVVKGIAKGKAIITAKAKDGSGKYVRCEVVVK